VATPHAAFLALHVAPAEALANLQRLAHDFPGRPIGGPGDDTLSAGPGNDRLAGSSGTDFLEGGQDTDHCQPQASDATDSCK
jgi:hypothetical protein